MLVKFRYSEGNRDYQGIGEVACIVREPEKVLTFDVLITFTNPDLAILCVRNIPEVDYDRILDELYRTGKTNIEQFSAEFIIENK